MMHNNGLPPEGSAEFTEMMSRAQFAVEVPREKSQKEAAIREQLAAFWKIKTVKDALNNSSQEPPWVIQDLLLKDTATLVSAHPHSMKSLSLLCACMQAVATKQVWGRFGAPSVTKSLFIETEDPEWLVEARIRGFSEGLEIKNDLPGFFYSCVGPFNLVEMKPNLVELLESYKPDFAVLSTLQGLLGGRDWLRQDAMADVNALFVDLSRRFCPLVVVTHSPWNKKERRAAGTITQAANFVTNVHFQKTNETSIHVNIDSKAGAGISDFSLKLNTEGNLGDASAVRSLLFAGTGWPRGSKKPAIIQALENDPEASSKVIAQRVGCDVRYVQRVRKEQFSEEEVE